MVRTTRRVRILAVTVIVGLVSAACSSDSSTPATTTAAPATTAAPTTTPDGGDEGDEGSWVEGCGPESYTDPAILSAERQPARCEPGFPAPKPLAERTRVVVASSFRLEFNSPLLLAISEGEFEKENIDIEFVNIRFSDAAPQLATGNIDVAVGGFELALFNAGNLNLPIRVAMGNYYPPDAGDYTQAQTGLWCRRDAFTNPADPDLLETAGLKWASSVGKGSVSVYYSIAEIERRTGKKLDVTNTVVEAIPSADALSALQNNAVQCAVLLDPFWVEIKDNPDYFLAASQTPGEPLGIYAYGSRMLENRELGVAFARAFIRSVNTYFQDDYHADDEVMEMISREIDRPLDALRALPSLVMDWEVRADTTTRIQELFLSTGTIDLFDTPVPEDKLVDRSFYLEAVGAPAS